MGIYSNLIFLNNEIAASYNASSNQFQIVKNSDGSFGFINQSGTAVRIKAASAVDMSDLATLGQVQSMVASGGASNLAFGSAAYANTTDFATVFQGLKADTALQPGANISYLTNDSGFITKTQADQLYTSTPSNTSSSLNLQNSTILDFEVTSANTIPNQLLYSFNISEYRTLKLILQGTCGTSYHSSEYFAMHDNIDVHSTEYAMLANVEPLYNVDMSISNGTCSITFTPSNTNTVIRANLTLINA